MKNLLFISISALCALFFIGCTKSDISGTNSSLSSSSGQGGSLARFAIVGNYLYTVNSTHLQVFDISDASNPVFVRTSNIGFEIETIFPFKDKLFIGSSSQIYIYSIEDPSNPQSLSKAISPTVMRRCDPVVAKDTVAYATLRTNGPCGGTVSVLAVYNIKDILNPVEVNQFFVSEPYGLGYADSVLYVCDKYEGLKVLNIKNAYFPTEIRSIKDNNVYVDVIPYGNTLVCWVKDGLVLYDISDNANPVLITKII
jgi:hypothetical protein